jgi:hypothetical protein
VNIIAKDTYGRSGASTDSVALPAAKP